MSHTVDSQFVRHNVPGLSVLIHSTPQILLLAIDFYEDFIEVERIAITTMSLLEPTSVSSAKLDTPESDGFVADTNASFGEQVLDITITEVKSMVEPDRVTDDIGRKSVTLVSISSPNY